MTNPKSDRAPWAALLAGVLINILLATSAAAQAASFHFDIPGKPLSQALRDYGKISGLDIIFTEDLVEGLSVAPLRGEFSAEDALRHLLKGTGLIAEQSPSGALMIRRASSGNAAAVVPAGSSMSAARYESAQARPQAAENAAWATTGSDDEREGRRPIEEIVITGTRIKGVKDQFSPVTQVSREEMDLAGFSNVSDIFETLPQNFGGGVTLDSSQASSTAGPGSASVNLRGLGEQATLILLNGHRLAPGGSRANFIDLSTIPVAVIDRVDIVTDGASAIYGSDAIAGVVNIILRDDFEGAETRLNVGTITDGGGDHLQAGQTLGWSGDRARAMVTYEYSVEDELDSTEKDFAVGATQPTWLLPDTEKHGVFASAGAQLSDRTKLSADGYFNDRKSKQFTSRDITTFSQAFQVTDVQQYGGAFGLDIELTNEWGATISGSYSKSDQFNNNVRSVTSDSPGGFEESAVTRILSFDGSIGGSLFNITDDPVRGVIGGHYRSEKATQLSILTPSQNVSFESDKSRNVYAAFGELYVPIVSDGNRMPGVESLAISVAARYEEYSDVGSSFDPKVGLAWSPITGLDLRGTYGTSFRAPRLHQLGDKIGNVFLSLFVDPMSPDGESVAISVQGNRGDLGPERSRTWTAGFDFAPESLDGFLLRGTYFNTVFRDQVGTPSVQFDSDFRFLDFTGIPERDVSQETVEDICARTTTMCFNLSEFFPALGSFSFDDVEVLLDQRVQNLSLSKVAGFDFVGSYDLSSTIGDWRFSLGGTVLTTFEQRVAPLAPIDDLLNTFSNPVDLKIRGGVQWQTASITSAIYVNHVGDYTDDEVPTGVVPIGSFTTVDATIRLDLSKLGNTPLTDGTFLSFSATNFLNEDPPRIGAAPLRAATFDAANANPAGRKIRILLTKRW